MTGRDPARAGYQGERLHLRVNRQAADALGEVLWSAATDPARSPVLRQTSLVLPDGRRLEVSVQVTDDGAVYNEHGEYVEDDRKPHGDISGDFAVNVAASRVMAAATSGYPAMAAAYRQACADGRVRPGRMWLWSTGGRAPRFVVGFPTKCHWREDSRLDDIDAGLIDLRAVITRHGITSIRSRRPRASPRCGHSHPTTPVARSVRRRPRRWTPPSAT